MDDLVAKKVENQPPPPHNVGNVKGRPPKPKLTDLLLRMAVGDCYDVNVSREAVKARIYRVVRDKLGAQRRFIVRDGPQPKTARVWRME